MKTKATKFFTTIIASLMISGSVNAVNHFDNIPEFKSPKNQFKLVKQDSHYSSLKIKETQGALNSLGYYAGEQDGKIGQETMKAIYKYQIDNGLNGSGELDEKTLSNLNLKLDSLENQEGPEDIYRDY